MRPFTRTLPFDEAYRLVLASGRIALPAPVAGLRRTRGWDLHHQPAAITGFVLQQGERAPPRLAGDGAV